MRRILSYLVMHNDEYEELLVQISTHKKRADDHLENLDNTREMLAELRADFNRVVAQRNDKEKEIQEALNRSLKWRDITLLCMSVVTVVSVAAAYAAMAAV